MKNKIKEEFLRSLYCFRRDLRLHDNHAFFKALASSAEVVPVFVFDQHILGELKNKKDSRVQFIFDCLMELKESLKKYGSDLVILYGTPEKVLPQLVKDLSIDAYFINRDYEPYAKERELKLKKALNQLNCEVFSFKDQVIFEAPEVLTKNNSIFKVFTPYKNEWLKRFKLNQAELLVSYPSHQATWLKKLISVKHLKQSKLYQENFSLADCGFKPFSQGEVAGEKRALSVFKSFLKEMPLYHSQRDIPSLDGTSKLSVHFRFGTLSIRHVLREIMDHHLMAKKGTEVWVSELIWREFYFMILDQFPHVQHQAYKEEYQHIKWKVQEEHFQRWCEGRTGFPIVDAGMRQLNQTGWMHNRLRMICASFLCKLLLIDWKKGEEYFAVKLIDFDLAANNGGWQWSASTGADSVPYFRIFNPYLQSKRFDPEGEFIKTYCPELKNFDASLIHNPASASLEMQIRAKCRVGEDYPLPIIDYHQRRGEAVKIYKNI